MSLFFSQLRRPSRSTLFPTRRSSDLRSRSMAKRVVLATRDLVFRSKLAAVVTAGGGRLTQDAKDCDLDDRSEEHTSELQSPYDLVCRLLLEKKKEAKIYTSSSAEAHL